jgi:hypothetical protein
LNKYSFLFDFSYFSLSKYSLNAYSSGRRAREHRHVQAVANPLAYPVQKIVIECEVEHRGGNRAQP